jgi:putative endonuclease
MSVDKNYFIYILASQKNGTLYTGVTSNLRKRIGEHKSNAIEGFTKEHSVHILVYYENFNDIQTALAREKQIKKWNRAWKLNLIEKDNPEWRDLSDDF